MVVKVSNLGWMSKEKENHVRSRMVNQGFGFS